MVLLEGNQTNQNGRRGASGRIYDGNEALPGQPVLAAQEKNISPDLPDTSGASRPCRVLVLAKVIEMQALDRGRKLAD